MNEVNARVALEQDTNNVGLFFSHYTQKQCLVNSKIILLVRPAVHDKVPLWGQNKSKGSLIHCGTFKRM